MRPRHRAELYPEQGLTGQCLLNGWVRERTRLDSGPAEAALGQQATELCASQGLAARTHYLSPVSVLGASHAPGICQTLTSVTQTHGTCP